MTTHTITATFRDGTVATRRTMAAYTFASKKRIGTQAGRGPTVRFHTNESAAREAAGSRGEVVRTDFGVDAPRDERACVVCAGDARGVPSTSAVTGDVTWSPCWGSAHGSR